MLKGLKLSKPVLYALADISHELEDIHCDAIEAFRDVAIETLNTVKEELPVRSKAHTGVKRLLRLLGVKAR